MHFFTIGLNHHTAPLAIREKLAFSTEHQACALEYLVASTIVEEAVILSTCNRTEIYCVTHHPTEIEKWLANYHGLSFEQVQPYLFILNTEETIQHAFRVASGLDSMVLGETQILGQMKSALRLAKQVGTVKTYLNGLFQYTFSVAKAVRSTTAVGSHSVSMAAAAVKLTEQIFPSIRELRILFVGAGEMVELVATHFAAKQPTTMTVANRTLERGQALAVQVGADAVTLTELPVILSRYDVVVTSTASTLPLIGKGMVEQAIKLRRHRPVFMLDLAVPRDIEKEVTELEDIFLYTVDDIASIVEVGKEARQYAASEAEAIIKKNHFLFSQWLKKRDVVPLICALRDKAEQDRTMVLKAAKRRLAKGESPESVLELLSKQLTNKLIHPPTHALSATKGEEHNENKRLIARFYQLNLE